MAFIDKLFNTVWSRAVSTSGTLILIRPLSKLWIRNLCFVSVWA